jgi:Holliday junction resolvase-like predicted endonuclease
MTNLSHGLEAEAVAAKYLVKNGFSIVNRNWKTKWCEIDIVASKNNTIYFTEVKYRLCDKYGAGLDYITPVKLKQMARAAEGWVLTNNWRGEYQLAAIEVTGIEYLVTDFITDI